MAVFEKYLKKKDFSSYEDFMDTFKIDVPVHFNFGYDVVDVYAEKQPEIYEIGSSRYCSSSI